MLTSPLQRARETCRLAGYGDVAQVDSNLREWSYGDYEGRTTAEVRAERPTWSLWADGPQAANRSRKLRSVPAPLCERIETTPGDVLLFAHGHILRILTACWLGLPPDAGRLFALGTAAIGVLGYERETRVMLGWGQ